MAENNGTVFTFTVKASTDTTQLETLKKQLSSVQEDARKLSDSFTRVQGLESLTAGAEDFSKAIEHATYNIEKAQRAFSSGLTTKSERQEMLREIDRDVRDIQTRQTMLTSTNAGAGFSISGINQAVKGLGDSIQKEFAAVLPHLQTAIRNSISTENLRMNVLGGGFTASEIKSKDGGKVIKGQNGKVIASTADIGDLDQIVNMIMNPGVYSGGGLNESAGAVERDLLKKIQGANEAQRRQMLRLAVGSVINPMQSKEYRGTRASIEEAEIKAYQDELARARAKIRPEVEKEIQASNPGLVGDDFRKRVRDIVEKRANGEVQRIMTGYGLASRTRAGSHGYSKLEDGKTVFSANYSKQYETLKNISEAKEIDPIMMLPELFRPVFRSNGFSSFRSRAVDAAYRGKQVTNEAQVLTGRGLATLLQKMNNNAILEQAMVDSGIAHRTTSGDIMLPTEITKQQLFETLGESLTAQFVTHTKGLKHEIGETGVDRTKATRGAYGELEDYWSVFTDPNKSASIVGKMRAGTGARALNAMRAFQDIIMSSGEDNLWEIPNTPGTNVGDRLKKLAEYGYRVPRNTGSISVNAAYKAMAENPDLGFTEAGQRRAKNMYAVKKYDPFSAAIQALQGNLKVNGKQVTFDEVIAAIPKMLSGDTVIGSTMETINESQITDLLNFGLNRKGTPLVENYGDISGLVRQIDIAKLQTLADASELFGGNKSKAQDAANQVLHAIMSAYGTDGGTSTEWRGAAAHGFSESQVLRVINKERADKVNADFQESVARAYSQATGTSIEEGRKYAAGRDIFRNLTNADDRTYKNAKAQGKGFEALNKAWTDSYVIGNFETVARDEALKNAGLSTTASDAELRAAGYRQSVIEDGKWTNSPTMALIDLARARKVYKMKDGVRIAFDPRIHKKEAQDLDNTTIVDPTSGTRFLADWKGFEATNGLGYADSRYLNSGAQIRGALGLKGSLQSVDTQGKTLAQWAYEQGIAIAMDRATGKQITGSVEDYIRTNTGANVGYFMQGFSGDLMSREKLESGSGRQGAMVDITNAQVLMDESLIKNMEIYKGLADDILTTKLAPFAGGRTDLKTYAQDLLARQSISKLEAGEQQAYEVAQEWANETARRGGELMSGLIELSPLRAATEYKHDKSNSAAIGGQMAKFLGLNPEFMAYQQAQSLARLQDLRTAGGARKYIFGDTEEDEFSREFNDEALGDAYMSANLGGIYERKKKEFMRSRSLAAGNAQIYNYDAQGINADGTRAFGAVGNIADKRLLDNLLTTSMIVAGTSTGGANALEQAREAGRYDEMTTFDQSSPAFQKVISRLKGYWGDTAVNETDVQRWLNLEGGLIDFEKQGYMVGTGARAPNGFGQYIGGINYAGVFNPVKSMFGSTQGLFVSNNYKGGMSGADMDADEAKMIYSNLYDVSRWGFDMGKEDQAYDTLNDDQKRARNMYMDMIRTLEGTGDSYIASSGNIDYKKLETNLAAFRQKYQKEIAHNFGLDKDTVQRTQEEIAARVRAGDTDTAAIGRLNDAEIAARIDAYSKQDLTSSMIRTLRQYDAIKMDAIKAGYDPLTLGLDFNERDLTPEQIAKAYGIDIRIKDDVATTIGGTNGKYKAIFANGKYNRGFVDDKGVERILKEGEEGYDDAVWKPDAKGKYGSGMFGSRLMQEVYMRRAAEAAMYMGRASDAGSRLSMLDLNDPINRIFARTAGGSNRLYDIYTTWQKKPSDVAEPKAISNALQLGNEYAKGINWINGSMARQLVGYYKDDEGNYIARELHDLANIQEIMQEEGRGQTNEGKKYTLDKIGAYSQASSGNLHPLGRDADEFQLNDASRDNLIGGRLMDVEEALGIRKENGQYTRNATRSVIKETSAGDFFYMGDLGGTLGNRNANGGYKIDALNLPSVYNPADLTGLMTRRNSMIAGLGDTTLALSLAETFNALDTGEFKEGGAAASLLKNMRYIKAGFMGGTRDIITDAEAEILLKQRYAAEAEIDRMVAEQKAAVEENAMMTGGSSKYGFKIKTGVDSEGKDTYRYGMTEQEYRKALMGNLGLNQIDLMLGTYKSPETGNYLETGMTYTNMAYRAFQNPNLAYRHTVGKFIDPIDNRSVNLLNEGTFEDSFGGPEDTRTQVVNMILDERNRRSRAIRAARATMSEDQQQGLLDAYDNAPTIQVADDTFKVMQAANAEGARRRQKAYEEAMERKRQMDAYLESDTPIPEEYVDNTSSAQKPTPKPAPEPAPKPVQRPTPTPKSAAPSEEKSNEPIFEPQGYYINTADSGSSFDLRRIINGKSVGPEELPAGYANISEGNDIKKEGLIAKAARARLALMINTNESGMDHFKLNPLAGSKDDIVAANSDIAKLRQLAQIPVTDDMSQEAKTDLETLVEYEKLSQFRKQLSDRLIGFGDSERQVVKDWITGGKQNVDENDPNYYPISIAKKLQEVNSKLAYYDPDDRAVWDTYQTDAPAMLDNIYGSIFYAPTGRFKNDRSSWYRDPDKLPRPGKPAESNTSEPDQQPAPTARRKSGLRYDRAEGAWMYSDESGMERRVTPAFESTHYDEISEVFKDNPSLEKQMYPNGRPANPRAPKPSPDTFYQKLDPVEEGIAAWHNYAGKGQYDPRKISTDVNQAYANPQNLIDAFSDIDRTYNAIFTGQQKFLTDNAPGLSQLDAAEQRLAANLSEESNVQAQRTIDSLADLRERRNAFRNLYTRADSTRTAMADAVISVAEQNTDSSEMQAIARNVGGGSNAQKAQEIVKKFGSVNAPGNTPDIISNINTALGDPYKAVVDAMTGKTDRDIVFWDTETTSTGTASHDKNQANIMQLSAAKYNAAKKQWETFNEFITPQEYDKFNPAANPEFWLGDGTNKGITAINHITPDQVYGDQANSFKDTIGRFFQFIGVTDENGKVQDASKLALLVGQNNIGYDNNVLFNALKRDPSILADLGIDQGTFEGMISGNSFDTLKMLTAMRNQGYTMSDGSSIGQRGVLDWIAQGNPIFGDTAITTGQTVKGFSKLGSIASLFGLPSEGAHDATFDSFMTAGVLGNLINIVSGDGTIQANQIDEIRNRLQGYVQAGQAVDEAAVQKNSTDFLNAWSTNYAINRAGLVRSSLDQDTREKILAFTKADAITEVLGGDGGIVSGYYASFDRESAYAKEVADRAREYIKNNGNLEEQYTAMDDSDPRKAALLDTLYSQWDVVRSGAYQQELVNIGRGMSEKDRNLLMTASSDTARLDEYANQADDSDTFRKAMNMRQDLENIYDHLNTIGIDASSGINTAFDEMYKNAQGFDPVAQLRAAGANTPEAANLRRFQQDNADQFGLNPSGGGPSIVPPVDDYSNGGIWGDAGSEAGGVASLSATQVNISGSSINIAAETVNLATAQTNAASAQTVNIGDMINAMSDSINERYNEGRNAGVRSVTQVNENGTSSTNLNGTTFAQRLVLAGLDASTAAAIGQRAGEMVNRGSTIADNVFKPIDGASSFLLTSRKAINDLIRENRNAINPENISHSQTSQQMDNLKFLRGVSSRARSEANRASDAEQRRSLLSTVDAFDRLVAEQEGRIVQAGVAESMTTMRKTRETMDSALDKRPGEMQALITRSKNAEDAYRKSREDVAVLERIEADNQFAQHASAFDPNNRGGETNLIHQLRVSREHLAQMQHDRDIVTQEYDTSLQDIYSGMDLQYQESSKKGKPTNMFELRKQILAERKAANSNLHDLRSAAEHELSQWKLGGTRNAEGQSMEGRDSVTLADFLSGNWDRFGTGVDAATGVDADAQRDRMRVLRQQISTWQGRLDSLNGPQHGVIPTAGRRWQELYGNIDDNFANSISSLRKLAYGGRNEYAEAALARDENIRRYDTRIEELRSLANSTTDISDRAMYAQQEQQLRDLRTNYVNNSRAEMNENIISDIQSQSLKYGGTGLNANARNELLRAKAEREARATLEGLKDENTIRAMGGVNTTAYQEAVRAAVENLSRVVANTVVDSSLRVARDGSYTFATLGTRALTIDANNAYMDSLRNSDMKAQDSMYRQDLSLFAQMTKSGLTKEDEVGLKKSQYQASLQKAIDEYRSKYSISDTAVTNDLTMSTEAEAVYNSVGANNPMRRTFDLLRRMYTYLNGTTTTDANGNTITTPAEFDTIEGEITERERAANALLSKRNAIKATGGRMTDEERYSFGREQGALDANNAMRNFAKTQLTAGDYDQQTFALTAAGRATLAANPAAQAAYDAIMRQQAYFQQGPNGSPSAYDLELRMQDENRSRLMELQTAARIDQTNRSIDYYSRNNRLRAFGGGMIGQAMSQANMIRNQYENNINAYDRDVNKSLVNFRSLLGNSPAGNSIYDVMQDRLLSTNKDGSYQYTAAQLYTQAQAAGFNGSQVDFTRQLESIRAMRTEAERMRGTLNSWNGPASTFSAIITSAVTSINTAITRFTSQMLRKGWQELKKYTVEMDTAYAKIQAITMKSDGEMEGVKEYTTSTAKELHTSASNVAKVEQELYRQGLSDSDVQSRTKTVLQYSAVTGADITKSVKQLTTAVNTGLVDSLEKATDAMVALGDAAATTANEIAAGMQKSAASAKVAGVSFEELTAFITIGTSKTQLGGSQVGNMLSTSMQRYRKIAAGGYDNEDGTTSNANDVEKALHTVGLSIFKEGSLTEMKDYTTVMREIAGKWNQMNDVEKSQVTYAMAGTRQGNLFTTYMEALAEDNGALLDEYIEKATNSAGTTAEKYSVVTDTIQTKLTDIKNAFDDFAASLDTDTIKNILGGVANTVSNFASLGGVGGLAGLAGSLIAITNALKLLLSLNPMLGLILGAITIATTSIISAAKNKKELEEINKEKDAENKVKSNNLALQRAQNREAVIDDYLEKGLQYRQKYASVQETIDTNDEEAVNNYLNNIKYKFPEMASIIDDVINGVTGSFDKLIVKLGELKGNADLITKEKALAAIQGFDYTSLDTEWTADEEGYFNINTRSKRYKNAFSELWGDNGHLTQTNSRIYGVDKNGNEVLVEPTIYPTTILGTEATTASDRQAQAAMLMAMMGLHYESGYEFPRAYSGAEYEWVKGIFLDNSSIMLPDTVTYSNPDNGKTGELTIGELYSLSTGGVSSDYETNYNDYAKIIAMLFGWSTGRVKMTDEQSALISDYVTDLNLTQSNRSVAFAKSIFTDYLEGGGLEGFEEYGLSQKELENAFSDWATSQGNNIAEMSGEEIINAFFESYTGKKNVKNINISDLVNLADEIKDKYGIYAYSYNVTDEEGNVVRTIKTDEMTPYALGRQYYEDEANALLIKYQEAIDAGDQDLADEYMSKFLITSPASKTSEQLEEKGYEMLNSGNVLDTTTNENAAKTMYSYYNPYSTSYTKRRLTNEFLGFVDKNDYTTYDELEKALNGDQKLLAKYGSLFQNENIANIIQDIKAGNKDLNDLIEALKGTIDVAANFKEINEKTKTLKSNKATAEVYQRIVAGTATTADYAAMESDLGYSIAGLTSSEITALANKGVSYYQDQNDQTARDLLNSAVDTIFNEIFLNGDSDKIRTIDVNRDWGTGEGDVGKILTELGYGDLAQSFSDQGIKGTIVYDSSLNEGKGGYKLTTVEYTGTSGASSKETFENAVAYTNTATETLNALSTIASFASAIANGSTYEEATRGFGESAFYALNSSGEAANIANLLNSDNTEEARGMAAALLTSTMSQMNQYLANGLKDQNVASWVTATTSEGRQNAVTSMKQVNQNLATNENLYTKLKNGTITEEELGNLANYLGVDVSQIRGNATEANRLMQYKRDTAATQKAEYDAKAFTKMREEAEKLGVAFDNIDEKTAADLAHEIAENTSLAGTEAQRLAQEYLDVEGSIGKAKKKAESLNKAIGEAVDQINLNAATKELDAFLKKASEADIASLYQGLTTGIMEDGSAINESWQNVILNSGTALTILGNYSQGLIDAKTAADQLAESLDKLAPKRSAESLDAYADAAIELLGTFTDEDTWKLGQSFMHNYLTNLSGNDAVGYAQLQERYPALFEMVQAGDWNAWQQAEASYTASREINTLTANDAFYGKSAEEFLGYISDYATAKAKNDTEGMNDAYQKMVAAYGEYSYYSRLTPTTWEEQQALLGYFGGNSYGDDVYTANKSAKATGMTEALSLAEKYLGDAATDFLIDYISYELGLGSNKVMTDAQSQAEFNNDLSDLWSDYYQEYLTKGYLPTIEGSPKYGKLVYTDFYKNTYLNDSLSVEDKASEAFKNTPESRRFSEKAIDNLTFADAAYIEYSKGGITALKEYLNSEKKVEAFLSVYNEFGDLLAEDTSGLTTELETMKINKSVSNRNRLYFQRQKDLKKFSNEQYNQYIAVQDYLDLETDDQKGWVREQASEYATYSLGLEAYNKKQRGETLTPAEADYIKNAFGVDQFSSELSDIVNEKIAKFGYLKQALSDYADEAIWTSIENTANQITTGVKDQVGTEAAYDAEVAEQMRLERDRFWTAYANWANGKGTMPDINSYTYLKNDKATRDLLADQNKSTAEKVQAGLGETTYGTVFGTSGTGNVAKTEANALKINAAFAKYRAGQLTHDEFLSTVYDVTKSDPAAMAMYTKIYGNSIDNYLKVGAVDESTLGYDYRVSAATGNKYKYEQQFKNNKIGKKQYETYAAGIDYGLLPVTDLASRNDFQMQYVNELLGYKKQIEAYKAYEAAGKDLSKITDKQVLETLKSMGTTEAEITKSYNTSNANYSGVYQGLIDSIGEQAAKDINTRAYNAYNYYTQAALIEAEQENARQVTSVETYKKAWDKYKANNYIWNDDWYDETDFDMLTTDTEWLNAIYGATNQADRTANIKNLATKTTPQGISYGYTLADAQAALDFIAAGNYSAVTSEFDTKAGWKEFLTSVLGQNVMGLLEEGADQTYASAYINKAYSSIASTITQNLFDAGDISSTQKSMEEEYAGAINPEDTKVLVDKWAEASANAYYANAIYKRYKEKGIDSLSTKELEQFKSVVGVDIFNTEAGDKLDLKLAQVGYADSILNPTDLMTYNDAIVAKYGYLINGNKLTAEANAEVNLSRQKNRDAAIAAILAGYDETGVIPEINLVDYGLMDDTEFMDIIYDKVSTPAMIAKKLEGMTTEAINNGLGNQATVTMADMLFSYLEEYAKIGDKAALENARNIWNNTEGISKVFSDYYGDIDVTGLFTGEGATEASKGDRLKALTEGGRIRKYKEYEIMNQYGYITDDEYSMLQTAQEIEKIKDEDKRELAVNEQLQQWQEQQNTDAQALRAALNYEAVANSTTMTYQEKVQAAREYIGADENMKASEVISQAAKKAENDRAAAQANIDNIMWLFDALSGEEFADIRNSLFGDMTREEIQAAYGATPSTYLSAGEAAVAESAYGNTDYYQEKFYGILGSGGDRQDILSAVMNDTELYTWITTQGGEAATILEQLTNRQISVNEAFAKYSSILGKDSKAMATYIQGVAKLNKEIKNYQYYINKGAANLDTDEQDELAGFFGYKDAKEALGSGETVEGMIENLKIFQQQDLDSLTSTLQDEVGSAFRDATGNVVKVDGLNIEVGAPNIIAEDIDLSGLEALGFEKAMAERVAYLMSLGYDVQYVKESAFNPETGEVYERLVPTVVGLNNSGSAGQRSSSGGGGKSTADKLLEKWKNKIAVNQHRINMLDKTAEGYKNKGELTNYGKILSYKNDEMLALKAEYLQANEELEALYAKTSTGTKNSDKEDAIKLRDQIGAQSDYTEMYKITTALIAGNS